MKKIDSFLGSTDKLSGSGKIEYALWVNIDGELYVQLVNNSLSGTFANLAFSVPKYHSIFEKRDALNELKGYSFKDKKIITVNDNNNRGFLKAVIKDLVNGVVS